MLSRLLSIIVILTLMGCNTNNPEQESIIFKIEQHRKKTDRNFKIGKSSPLLPEDKKEFTGLNYFPIDLNLRFEGPIVKYDSMIVDTIIATGGDRRAAAKFGYFKFDYKGKEYRLQVYKMLQAAPGFDKHLFLGFSDETRGKETYGGGRYINLSENDGNFYVVDFNMAYNPYCVYNPGYSCAIPSTENHLPFAVTAGEKNFKEH